MDSAAIVAAAPAVRRARAFVDWVGGGRALTQTGRLRRADALALVELLETGDRLDPRFPIRSSADLYRVSLCVEWAKACRLVRVVRGRLVPVSKAAKVLDRPLELVVRMLEALPRLVDELGDSVVAFDATHTVEAVFGGLVGQGGRLSSSAPARSPGGRPRRATGFRMRPRSNAMAAPAATPTFGGCSTPPPTSAC